MKCIKELELLKRTANFCSSDLHRVGQVPDYWIFQIIRQRLYQPKM